MRKLWLLAAVLIALVAQPATAVRIECITASTIDGSTSLSATSIRVQGGPAPVTIEVYSSDDAVSGPTTCTAPDGTVITCAGWDTNGSAEIWVKNDRNGPFLQMTNTVSMSAATRISPSYESDSLVALKVTATGAGGDACLYLSITGAGLDSGQEIQDGDSGKSWAKDTP